VTALALGKHEKKGCEGILSPLVVPIDAVHCPEPKPGDFIIPNQDIQIGRSNEWPWPKDEHTFSDRHQTKGTEKCPKCNEIWADFLIIDGATWVCLACGCHFTPRERLNAINEYKLAEAERRRATPNRVCGQTETVAEAAGVPENSTST
jgi:hypothetical protein